MKKFLFFMMVAILLISSCATTAQKDAMVFDNMKHAAYSMNYFNAANGHYPTDNNEMLTVMIDIPQDLDNPYNALEKAVIFGNTQPEFNKENIGKVYIRYSKTGVVYVIYGYSKDKIMEKVILPAEF